MLPRPANRQSNDIATRLVPLVKHSIAARNEQLEIVRRKGNLAIDPFGAKKYKPAAQFNVRHFLSKEALVHEPLSPCSYAEQGKDDGLAGFVKPLKALTASVCRINCIQPPANDPLPEPANDTDWPEAA